MSDHNDIEEALSGAFERKARPAKAKPKAPRLTREHVEEKLVAAGMPPERAKLIDAEMDAGLGLVEAVRRHTAFIADAGKVDRIVQAAIELEVEADLWARGLYQSSGRVAEADKPLTSGKEKAVRAVLVASYRRQHGNEGAEEFADRLIDRARADVVKAGGGQKDFEERLETLKAKHEEPKR